MPTQPSPAEAPKPAWRAGFAVLLVAAMASANLFGSTTGILASFLLDDLGINRTKIGALITASILVTAVASPVIGVAADALGGRRALAAVFAASAIGLLGVSVLPYYWVMFIPVCLAAMGQAAANPATNKLIALHSPPGRQGWLTGIKQSGVQVGIFFAGILAPSLALAVGWRWTLAIVALLPLIALPTGLLLLPRDEPSEASGSDLRRGEPLSRSIRFLFLYGALMGFGVAYTFLVPLFVEEGLGLSERIGGLAAGLTGLVAIIGRVLWARVAEGWVRYDRILFLIAVVGVVAAGCYLASTWVGAWLAWFGVALTGMSSSSWTSVGMLAVMRETGSGGAGRASGLVMSGFLTGLGIAPTFYGWTADVTGSYSAMWVASMAVLTGAVVLSLRWMGRVSE